VILHVVANPIRALAIEATKQNTANSHSDIVSKAVNETCAFQTNVRRTDAQRLAGTFFQGKNVVRGNGKFATLALEWQGTSTRCNQKA
jgi:hypothetical protein